MISKQQLQILFDSDEAVKVACKRVGVSEATLKKYFIVAYGQIEYDKRKTRLKKLSVSGMNNYQARNKIAGKKHWNRKAPEDMKSYIAITGYRMIGTPSWFTGLSSGNMSLEHQVIYCKVSGITAVPKGYIIHHIDEDKLNNDVSNLEMMSRADHARLHHPGPVNKGSTTIPKGSTAQVNGAGKA